MCVRDVTLAGRPAQRGDCGERGRADGGGDQLSETEGTDDLLARGGEHPLSLLTQVNPPSVHHNTGLTS